MQHRAQTHEELLRFRAAMDMSGDAIYLVDRTAMRFVDVNQTACTRMGYGREELLKMGPQDLLAAGREEIERVYDKVIAAGANGITTESSARSKDGRTSVAELHRRALRSGEGWIIVSIARDITARKTEARLLGLEHAVTKCLANADSVPGALREVMQTICESEKWDCGRYFHHDEPAGIMRFYQGWSSDDAAMKRFNSRSAGLEYARGIGLVGLAWQSGKPVWSADATKDPRVTQAALARDAGLHGAFAFPAVFEGRTFGVLSISSRAVHDPGERLLQSMRVIASQIGQFLTRKRAEDALRASEEKFSKAFHGGPDSITLSKLESGEFLDVNEGFARLSGYSRGEAIGRTAIELGLWTKPGQRAALSERLASGAAVHNLETVLRRKDGEERTVIIWLDAIDLGGEKFMLTIGRDVTEQKRATRERAVLEAQLRQSQKMEAVGTLAGGIAHDFNNIIGAILGNAALAREDIGSNHAARQSIEEIDKAGRRARDLVQQILAFSRKQALARSVIALGPVVEEALKLLQATLPAGVRLEAVCAPDAPNVIADQTQVHQVLMNLCTNAWHAMEGRPGHIDIRLEEVTVDAEFARMHADLRPGKCVRLSVRDTGKGMDAAMLERIFEPFFTTKAIDEGTGLGLSVVHGIVRGHGGAIVVDSTPGIGTTFQLYFPAVDAPVTVHHPAAAVSVLPRGRDQHVLYLDDDEALVSLVSRMLARQGYRVSGYTLANEALDAVRADPGGFDLVVSDYNMPGMSGLDVARELRGIRPDLPVAVTSGYITDELREKAPLAGVRHLIYKPDTVDELCEVVRRLTSEADAGDQRRA
jgi:PAS domain S-box-containing protein